MIKSAITSWMAAAAVFTLAAAPVTAAVVDVDTELQLLLDVSGSVSATEFALQRDGYVNAFKNAALQALILDTDFGNRFGKIAVQLVYWSGAAQRVASVEWTLIDSEAAADAFADAIAAVTRPFSGLTAPGSAINFATPLFFNNDFNGTTQVIDVSGDGEQNDGANTAAARNAALAAGVDRINGLPILTSAFPNLDDWYAANIQGGTGGFTLPAQSFADFEGAILKKLEFEATGETPQIPLPASAILLFSGVAGLGAFARRQAAKAV